MSNTPEIAKLNSELYSLLRTRGYKPATVDSQNQRVPTPEEADVIEFEFIKDGESYGKVWATVEDGNSIKIYYDNTQPSSPKGKTPGLDYDDSWTGFLKHLKNWSTKRQLNFDLLNKDRLNDDMKRREYYRKEALEEGYYPINKSTSWNDSVPQVKLIIHHKNPMADGDKRHKNIDRIFIQNNDEERFLLPTRRPGIARVYARHVAKGGLPNDERWNHIKDMCDEYNKIGGFVRATRGKQYEESIMELVEEGRNHFKKCRENLMKISKTRGYDDYFENDYMEMVNETECDESLLEKFDHHPKVKESLGIISRLNEKVKSMKELRELEEWAESIVESSDDKCEHPVKEEQSMTDDDWVVVKGRKPVRFLKNPKNNKAPRNWQKSSDEQEVIRVSKAKQMGIIKKESDELEEQLDELDSKTLSSYMSKASDARGHRELPTHKVDNRYKGVSRASKKLDKKNKEEQLDETLGLGGWDVSSKMKPGQPTRKDILAKLEKEKDKEKSAKLARHAHEKGATSKEIQAARAKAGIKEEKHLDESIEFHVRLDHLDGSDKIDDVIEILKKYEEGGKINYEAETDKGVVFNADSSSDVRRLDRELRRFYTGAEINEGKKLDEEIPTELMDLYVMHKEAKKKNDKKAMSVAMRGINDYVSKHGEKIRGKEAGRIMSLAPLDEAEYQGKKVQLNKPKRGGSKKYYVYVKNPKTGKVKKISFGDPGLRTKSGSKGRAKSFAARHQCEKKNDKMTAGYWACRLPRYGLVKGGKWW